MTSDIDKYGPGLWATMHIICLDEYLSTRVKEECIRFIIKYIPCEKCRKHASEYVSRRRINQQHIFRWTYDFHCSVNARLGKRQDKYSHYKTIYRQFVLTPRISRGVWYFIHLLCLSSDNSMDFTTKTAVLRTLVDNIKCTGATCTLNKDYTSKYMLESFEGHLFRWSYKFHKEYNDIMGYDTRPYNEMKEYYRKFLDLGRKETCMSCRL